MNFQRKRTITPLRVGVAAALLLALAVTARAVVSQETTVKRSVLDALPANTSLVLRLRNCTDLKEKFKKSPFYGLRNIPEIKEFISRMETEVKEGISEVRDELGFDPLEILGFLEGEITFAVGDLGKIIGDLAAGAIGGGPDVQPGDIPILVSMDAGAAAPELRDRMGKIFEFAQREGARKEVEDFRGGKITILSQAKDGGSPDIPEKIYYGDLGSVVLVSISRPYLEQTMANLTSPPEEALVKNPDFVSTQQQIGVDSDFMFFLNIRAIANAARKSLQANPFGAMIWGMVEGKLLGRSLKNFAFSISVRENDLQQVVFVNNGGASDGILGIMKGPTLPGKPSPIIPEDVGQFSSLALNIQALYALIIDLANQGMAMQGMPGGAGGAPGVEETVEAMFGVKLRTVVDALGSELHFYSTGGLNASNPLGDFTLAMTLKDEMPVRELLNKVMVLLGGAPQKYLDRDLYPLNVSAPGGDGPTLGIVDNLLVAGFTADAVKDVIRRSGKTGKNIGDTPGYQKLAAVVPARVTSLSYESVESMEERLKSMNDLLTMADASIEVPDLSALAGVLEGVIGYGVWKEQGLYGETLLVYKKGSE